MGARNLSLLTALVHIQTNCPPLSRDWLPIKRPTLRFRWKPSKSPKLSVSFGEVVAIVAVVAFFVTCLVLSVLYPPPFRPTGSSFGPDWDYAPGPYTTACVKRIVPAK